MEKELIETIAYENGLEYILTTAGMNGYPESLRGAIIGFESFEKAETMAKEHGLVIRTFFKRNGWNLYQRDSNTTWGPLEISCDDYGDDYNQFGVDDIDDFFENEVSPMLGDFDNFEDLQKFIDNRKKIYDELQMIDETQCIITCQGNYYETIDKKTMQWNHDSKTWVIGVMKDEF